MSDRVPFSNGTSTSLSSPPPQIPDHTLVHRIAEGAYGEVWLARNALGQGRAVKIVRRSRFKDSRPFEREYAGIRRYEPVSRSHEGLMDVLQVGPDPHTDWFYYVMELADPALPPATDDNAGGTEKTPVSGGLYRPRTLNADLQQQDRLPVMECLRLGIALCHAVEHLHQRGLVHRDLKPSNVIFVDGIPKLSDPGLVTDAQEPPSFVGTTGFVPPEGPGRPLADVFSLGRILYSASTGKGSERFPEPISDLHEPSAREEWAELNSVILRACASDPRHRYPSAAALREDLERLRDGRSVRQLAALRRRLRRIGIAAVALGVLATLSLVALAWQRRQNRQSLELQELVSRRQKAHSAPWREPLLDLIRKTIPGPGRLLWRSEAVAALDGLDARLDLYWKRHAGRSVAFNSRGTELVVGGGDQPTAWVSLDPETVRGQTGAEAMAVTFDASDRPLELTTTEGEQGLCVRRVDTRDVVARLEGTTLVGSTPTRGSYRFVAHGTRIAGTSGDRVLLWNAENGRQLWEHGAETSEFAVNSLVDRVALGLQSGEILICPLDGGSEIRLPAVRRSAVSSLAFGRDPVLKENSDRPGWLLFAGDTGGVVTVWDLTRNSVRTQFRGLQFDVRVICVNSDSTVVATGGRAEIQLWDLATGVPVLSGLLGDFHQDLTFSSDGRRLATTTREQFSPGMVGVWSLEAGRGIQAYRGLASKAHRPVISSDGRWLAAVSGDWHLAVWELGSGRLRWIREIPEGFSPDNVGVAFTRDGSRVATVAGTTAATRAVEDGHTLQMWTLPPGISESAEFDDADRLLSFRLEGPANEKRLPVESRRVGRLRALESSGMRVLREFPEFHEGVSESRLTPDGTVLLVCGPRRDEAGLWQGVVTAVDTQTAETRWTQTVSLPRRIAGAKLFTDVEGTLAAVSFFDSPYIQRVFDLASGAPKSNVQLAPAISRGGTRLLVPGQPVIESTIGISLVDSGRIELVLGPDDVQAGEPVFDRRSSIAVWSTRSGVIHACFLDQVRQNLERAKIPW